jgi:hypothetical protein
MKNRFEVPYGPGFSKFQRDSEVDGGGRSQYSGFKFYPKYVVRTCTWWSVAKLLFAFGERTSFIAYTCSVVSVKYFISFY